MFVDAMAHLNDPRIIGDIQMVLQRAGRCNVSHIINAGVNPCRDLALPDSPYPQIYKAYGIHPMALGQDPLDLQMKTLERRLQETNVVAVGEIGLDKRPGMPDMALQLQAFTAQLSLAAKMNLPVILHSVKTGETVLREIRKQDSVPCGGLWHGYTGSPEFMKQIISAGLHVSFGGHVTYAQSKKCRVSATEIDLQRLLVESDCPDHPPYPSQLNLNEPKSLSYTVAEIAKLRGEPASRIKQQTAENAMRLFQIG